MICQRLSSIRTPVVARWRRLALNVQKGRLGWACRAGQYRASAKTRWGLRAMLQTIRPDLNVLRRLPTIHQVSESWGKLELKLETGDTRYWLTTEGVTRKTSGTPINYVVDYVTVEKRSDDGSWDLKAVYSPEAWKLSQGFDYSQMLSRELEQKRAELEDCFSWDLVGEIESLERELALTNQAVFDLSEKVRQAWV